MPAPPFGRPPPGPAPHLPQAGWRRHPAECPRYSAGSAAQRAPAGRRAPAPAGTAASRGHRPPGPSARTGDTHRRASCPAKSAPRYSASPRRPSCASVPGSARRNAPATAHSPPSGCPDACLVHHNNRRSDCPARAAGTGAARWHRPRYICRPHPIPPPATAGARAKSPYPVRPAAHSGARAGGRPYPATAAPAACGSCPLPRAAGIRRRPAAG